MRDTEAVSITPIPLWNNEEWRCRYVFGYSLDDSDKPVFLVWPERTENNGFWILDVDRDHYHNQGKFPASRTWVWSTSMQPLALVVLGISGLPQPVPLASARTTLVKIVPSQWNLLTGYSRCNMAYPAKPTFRREQKLLRRKYGRGGGCRK